MTRTRLATIVLSIMFAIGLMPGLAFAANGGDLAAVGAVTTQATDYNVWVADTRVTSDNASNITGEGISGKVSYDAASNTLTLNNATISKDHMAAVYTPQSSGAPLATYYYYNIYHQYDGVGSFTIKLVGNNKLTSPYAGTNIRHRGIGFGATDDNLEIIGDGTLTVTASATDFIIGIECENLTVGPKATVKASISVDDDSCTAVRAGGTATVKGTLEVSSSGKDYSNGLVAAKGLSVPKGGKVIANAKDKGTSTFTGASAINAYKGNSTVNGYVKATSTWAGIEGDEGISMTVGATGEVIASGKQHALEDIGVKLGSSALEILAGDSAKTAKAVKASGIGESKYVHICKAKKANPMTAKAKTVTFSAAKLKTKARSVSAKKAFTVKKAKGTVTYKVKKYVTKAAKGKVQVAKNGKVTVKKGTKKGTYKLNVKITAAGNSTFKAKSKTVKLTVIVK